MMSRFATFLLVPLLLLPHGMGFRHSHGDSGPGHDLSHDPSHDRQPHIHVGWLFHHDHGVHDRDDCENHPAEPTPAEPMPAPHHDDDAVAVAGPFVLTSRAAASLGARDEPARTGMLLSASLFPPPAPTAFVPRPHPPPACGEACPIYLRTLSLLL